MHNGSYDTEKESFKILEEFCEQNNYEKVIKEYHHHEIYLTDPRRCAPEKNRTVLRFNIKGSNI